MNFYFLTSDSTTEKWSGDPCLVTTVATSPYYEQLWKDGRNLKDKDGVILHKAKGCFTTCSNCYYTLLFLLLVHLEFHIAAGENPPCNFKDLSKSCACLLEQENFILVSD